MEWHDKGWIPNARPQRIDPLEVVMSAVPPPNSHVLSDPDRRSNSDPDACGSVCDRRHQPQNWPIIDGLNATGRRAMSCRTANTTSTPSKSVPSGRMWRHSSPEVGAYRRSERQTMKLAATNSVLPARATTPSILDTILPPPTEPLAVARELLSRHYTHENGSLLLRSWRGDFWDWIVSHWSEVETAAIRRQIYFHTEHASFLSEKGPTPWAPNRNKIANVIEAIRAITYLRNDIDTPSWIEEVHGAPHEQELVATGNGLLHVSDRVLHPHDPRFFNETSVPFDYLANAPAPTRWLSFLQQLWPDDPVAIETLQQWFGYVISGRRDLQNFLLIGPPRAGKGVIARVLTSLVGRHNTAGPTLASLGTNFGLSPLIGKSLAIVSDARLGTGNVRQVVERLLSISGEDMLTIDRKYREPWTGTLPTRFVVASNELPQFRDASGAIATRFVVLTLRNSFLGKENPDLTLQLLDELSEILNWSLDGLHNLNIRGRFTEPDSSNDAIRAFQDLASPLAAFVREHCRVGPYDAPIDALYEAWRAWASSNGHKAISVQTFGRDLRAVVPNLKMTRPREGDRQRRYSGIGLIGGTDKAE